MARSYEQHCGLAHALDLVGERWTLLVVRELLAGPRRYTDLADGLVSVPSNVLAARLKDLEARGLVAREALPPPAASVVVYRLTDLGRQLAEPVEALARWGMRTLPPARDARAFRPHWLVLALQARFAPEAAAGLTETYEFTIDGEEGAVARLEIVDGHGAALAGPAEDAAVRIAADADTLIALTGFAIAPDEAIARGARIEGDLAAIARMISVLPAPGAPVPA